MKAQLARFRVFAATFCGGLFSAFAQGAPTALQTVASEPEAAQANPGVAASVEATSDWLTSFTNLVDTVDGYRGGNYGFFSAHASNTFSIALFFSLLFRQRLFTVFAVAWSLTNCWTRLYLGVHYPGDILVGLMWGALVGFGIYKLYRRLTIPVTYTKRLCVIPVCVLILTLVCAVIYAVVRA